ncbi:MAG: acyl-CoA thioesterase [Dysgonamonadaceae bacterium]|jgi:acyl-CoA thioester hydrolase|nr:acyl-CoA thioesterase [Dysgonamonadaceae bacterium]
MIKKYYETEFKVRDYECDAQGIVNNANYLHYTEITRHEFLESLGISFMECHKNGIDPVVVRADLHYKTSLVGSDVFLSSLCVERKGPKIVFHHTIKRKSDLTVCCKATVEVATIVNGKLTRGEFFDDKLKDWFV